MKIHYCEQGSPEWHELHRGRPTASDFDKILTPKTLKPSASQDPFINKLIAGAICYHPNWFSDSRTKPPNAAMQNGIDCEPEARRWYAMEADTDVTQVGFIESDDGTYGCSPDGVLGLHEIDGKPAIEGCLELKCPMLETHIGYLRDGGLPSDYKCQVHGQLIVTGAAYVDFVSYAAGAPALKIRVTPDAFTVALRAELRNFINKYLEALAKVRTYGGQS